MKNRSVSHPESVPIRKFFLFFSLNFSIFFMYNNAQYDLYFWISYAIGHCDSLEITRPNLPQVDFAIIKITIWFDGALQLIPKSVLTKQAALFICVDKHSKPKKILACLRQLFSANAVKCGSVTFSLRALEVFEFQAANLFHKTSCIHRQLW